MNIALGALIILLLLLPALFFRIGIYMARGVGSPMPSSSVYYSLKQKDKFSRNQKFSREQVTKSFISVLSKLNFSETLFFFSIVPLFLHIVSLWVLSWFGSQVDYEQLLKLFSSNVAIVDKNTFFGHELIMFLVYNIVEAMLGLALGWLLTYMVISKPEILRSMAGDNVWFKLFTGLLLQEEVRSKVDAILVDVLCETKEASIIYSGFLEKFDVNENNQIDYITLITATRRDLRQGSQIMETTGAKPITSIKTSVYLDSNGPIMDIPGKYFTILGNKISNINVTYLHYKVDRDPDNETVITNEGWVKLQ